MTNKETDILKLDAKKGNNDADLFLLEKIHLLEDELQAKKATPEITFPTQLIKIEGLTGGNGKDGTDGTNGTNGKNGKDGKNGTDGRNGIDGINGIDGVNGSPDTAEQVRDKLESLPDEEKLTIEAIKDLRKELDALKKLASKRPLGGGGGGNPDVSHWPRNEAFTMNGSDTTVTLVQGVGAAGNAIIVRYQGQTLDMGTHYTVSGNVVTLVGFTPEANSIISVTYWP